MTAFVVFLVISVGTLAYSIIGLLLDPYKDWQFGATSNDHQHE